MQITTQRAPVHYTPTVVALGDSLTAGTQDSTTVENRQAWSYMPQLARAVGIPFNMAYMSEGGVGPRVFLDGEFNYGKFQQRAQNIGQAIAPLQQQLAAGELPTDLRPIWSIPNMGHRTPGSIDTPDAPQHNFAVPGYEARHVGGVCNTRDYLIQLRDGVDASGLAGEVPLIRNIIQNGTDHSNGSALQQAIRRQPDLAVVWAGSNDALECLFAGNVDDRVLTPVEDRQWTWQQRNPATGEWETRTTPDIQPGYRTSILGEVGIVPRLLRETDTEILLMTIPDVTVIPTLRPMGQKVGDLPFRVTLPDGTDVTPLIENWVLPTTIKGAGNGGRTEFPPGSAVTMDAVLRKFAEQSEFMQTEADLKRFLDETGKAGLFSEREVMDPDELRTVSERVQQFNQVIEEAARLSPRVHVLDINETLQQALREGRPLIGEGPEARATTTFTGTRDARGFEGIFSYDGVHPSDTGHAVVANLILDKVKAELGDDPRFECFAQAAPIDEKAVLAIDPHNHGAAASTVVLGTPAMASTPQWEAYVGHLSKRGET